MRNFIKRFIAFQYSAFTNKKHCEKYKEFDYNRFTKVTIYLLGRPFHERRAILGAHAHTHAKAFRIVINRTRKSNF